MINPISWKAWCPICNRMTKHHLGGCAEHTVEIQYENGIGGPNCPGCNSANIKRVEDWNGIDGPGSKHYYRYTYCLDCGVMFQEGKNG